MNFGGTTDVDVSILYNVLSHSITLTMYRARPEGKTSVVDAENNLNTSH